MGIKRVYRRTSPYPGAALRTADFTQTADVLYSAHIQYPPQKLQRFGHTDWRWSTITFGPTIETPTGASATASTPNTTEIHMETYSYKITGINDEGSPVQESRASAAFTVSNDLSLHGNYNTITLPAYDEATRYIVYKQQAGTYGYIGNTDEATFRDNNIIPVLSEAPPNGENPFNSTGMYPSSVALHQQRLVWGGTRDIINGIWLSRSADFENMDKARPVRADDALAFALVSDRVNAITHIISMEDLMIFSGDSIWSVEGADNGIITPSGIVPRRHSTLGAARIKPIPVGTVIFYITARGVSMRALGFSFEIEGYKSDNVSIFAPHLFDQDIVAMAYQEEPYSCIWAAREDGTLLCFTWEQEQEVWGWSLCETDGLVEDLAVIAEEGNDRLYAVIRRTINGVERKFLERMAVPHDEFGEACHLDCAVTQVFDPAQNVVDGLWHLEGAEVSVTYDGYAVHGLTVENGSITLPNGYEAELVTVGLRYSGALETLPAALTGAQGSAHTNRQQIEDVVVRMIDTKGIEIGVSGSSLMQQIEPEDGDDAALTPDLSSVDYAIPVPGDWKDTSTVIIEQNEPFPAHIVGIFAGMKVSDR